MNGSENNMDTNMHLGTALGLSSHEIHSTTLDCWWLRVWLFFAAANALAAAHSGCGRRRSAGILASNGSGASATMFALFLRRWYIDSKA
jgi:hypothetical protein